MFSKQLIHLEHIRRICLKHQAKGIITNYLSLVTRILEVVFPNVCPKLLHNLNQARWRPKVTSRYSIATSQNLIKRKFACTRIRTWVLGMVGSPTTACSSVETPQTLFRPPEPPLLLAAAGALQLIHNIYTSNFYPFVKKSNETRLQIYT